MEKIESLLEQILFELKDINEKLGDLTDDGSYNLTDIVMKLDDIAGPGSNNSITDVCEAISDAARRI